MMALEGRCKALDAAADGYVRGEAAVSALLHPILDRNSADTEGGWVVLLTGTAVNQGGRSSTLTAPNGPSQQAVIRAALDEAELAPASITALSMHGTGRGLGGSSCGRVWHGEGRPVGLSLGRPVHCNLDLRLAAHTMHYLNCYPPLHRRHPPGRPH